MVKAMVRKKRNRESRGAAASMAPASMKAEKMCGGDMALGNAEDEG
jgi:hypothetical protein